ncbi:oxidoreductase, Gfo/Idh/MocA family [Streptococcus gordonii]|uniref:Oxidoreductase, Gfo/Idh/MocA family n=1 Tax=Streptococcus gordonii TaxID=1302 RepID=A0A139N935_STRGN|nr:oxidoreductase, Gfo/Idh/MocA family [Streptococcus gordonii]
MQEEAQAFATVLLGKEKNAYEEWLESASAVHQTLWTMRKDAGIRFEVDYD